MKCLACYKEIYSIETGEYHPRCSKLLFDSYKPPVLKYTLEETRRVAGPEGTLFAEVQKFGSEKRLSYSHGGNFFLRLPQPSAVESAELENTTLDTAHTIGVYTSRHGFARLSSGELVFIAKRFEIGSACTEIPQISSLEEAGRLITELSDAPGLDAVRFLERLVFAFIAGVTDVNFAIHTNNVTGTRLTAAYSLFPSALLALPARPSGGSGAERINSEQKETFSLSINGKKTNITKNDFLQLSSNIRINLKAAENVFEGFSEKIWESLGCMSHGFLRKETVEKYRDFIKERASLINL
ncbi:MAG: hypothetical protein L0Y79_12100 [Chlorobi bacterium]|nr:hypothetical protein [Chlorobiota bacterium]MCI0715680.1 hypothetical protein [Chlorobiota bacterium]